MAIPTLTKEQIFSIKDRYFIADEREFSTEQEFDDYVAFLNERAIGYVKGLILETYWQYIADETWKEIICMFCYWQSLNQVYSNASKELVIDPQTALNNYLSVVNSNIIAQATRTVDVTKARNMRIS